MMSQVVQGTWLKKGGSGVNVLIKNTENRLFPSFSQDLAFYGKIWLFYAQKWISLKKLGTLLNPLTPGYFAKKCLSKQVKPF